MFSGHFHAKYCFCMPRTCHRGLRFCEEQYSYQGEDVTEPELHITLFQFFYQHWGHSALSCIWRSCENHTYLSILADLGSVTYLPRYMLSHMKYCAPGTCSRHTKTVFCVKMPWKYRLPNTWYFRKILSVTNCVWIRWVYLSSFYANWCKTDRDIYNSLKTFQNKKISSAPSVPTLAVISSRKNCRLTLFLHILKFCATNIFASMRVVSHFGVHPILLHSILSQMHSPKPWHKV